MSEIRYIDGAEQKIKQLRDWRGLGEMFSYCGVVLTVVGHYKTSHPLAEEQLKYIPVPIYDYTVDIRTPLLRAECFSEVKGEFISKDFSFDMLEVLKVQNQCT